MRRFAQLFLELDASNRVNDKVDALRRFFSDSAPEDSAWAVSLLTGRRVRRSVSSRLLQEWASDLAGVPLWLFGECYDAVGDLAETIALLLPDHSHPNHEDRSRPSSLTEWMNRSILPLAVLDEAGKRDLILQAWLSLDRQERFVFNKLITGAFRVGVSQELVVRALAQVADLPNAVITHRLMGEWEPTADRFLALIGPDAGGPLPSQPYPFCLAHPLDGDPDKLGGLADWLVEWKWDGIRAQLVRRSGESFLWSRGEELITDRFPEIKEIADHLPDGTVIDGEIVGWANSLPLPFLELQRRIGRKTLSKRLLQEVPVAFLAFDLLEDAGRDLREQPLSARRARLEALHSRPSEGSFANELGFVAEAEPWRDAWILSQRVQVETWEDLAATRQQARDRRVEGFMLKRLDSPYQVGRKKGIWWKWKVDPFTVDAVVMYAQRGSGKRASLYTDYTFGLWEGDSLVPFAKAYSGLSDDEIRRVDAWVRRNTLEKFGPVRTVNQELVMELAFEGIQLSTRHKSGIAVRFPRIVRWRHDKTASEADRLQTVKDLLGGEP